MYKRIPKTINILILLFIILNTFSFLFFNLAYSPSSAATWKNPTDNLQIKIPGIEKFNEVNKVTCSSGVCQVPWISVYIAAIYKYAIGIVGILATVVMMVGGVMWIVAGGNATRIGEAKAWIGAALTGLVLALTSYVILYQVNPQLTQLKPIEVKMVDSPSKDSDKKIIGKSNACIIYASSKNVIDYTNVGEKTISSACDSYNFDTQGFDDNLIKAIAMQESGCNPNAESPDGACGLMQLLPKTASNIMGKNLSCEWLKSHPQESIEIATNYILLNYSKHNYIKQDMLAGYNSGYEPTTSDNKKAALAASEDCEGVKAYECCINPGGLTETQDYVLNTLKYYNSLN